MTRPEGAGNAKPTKSDIVGMLKGKGININYLGKDAAATKKSVLESMAKEAGIDIYAEKKALSARRPGSSIEACLVAIGEKGTSRTAAPEARSSVHLSGAEEDFLEEEFVHLNQEGVTPAVTNSSNTGDSVINDSVINGGRPHTWSRELVMLGYGSINRPAPNKAVQTILACILKKELHQHIIGLERSIVNHDHSAIVHMGMSNFLSMVSSFSNAEYDIEACKDIINSKYSRLPMVQFNYTQREASNLRIFVRCLTALEKANGVKFTFPNTNRRVRPRAPAAQVQILPNAMGNNCLFNINMIPDEYRAAFEFPANNNNAGNNAAAVVEEEEERPLITMLSFFNCGRFPIMTQCEVESHGTQFKQAIWKSKNLGVIAPISVEAWKKLASITDQMTKEAFYDADNCIRRVDKLEVTLPFAAKCLGLECSNSKTILIGQKNHQARVDERRHDFYIKKMWRTFCPFIKCTCSKAAKENGDCQDSIIWLDHAVWFLMNNLEMAWPTYPTMVRFGFFCSILSTKPFQTAVVGFITYLKVRDNLLKMAVRYSEDQEADLNMEFGNNKLSDILEKTVKPLKFLISKQENVNKSMSDISRKRQSESEGPDSSIIMPPKLYKRPESINSIASCSAGKEVIEIEDTGLTEGSVTKANTTVSRSLDVAKCSFESSQ